MKPAGNPLADLVHAGRLKREPTSTSEVRSFLANARRALADAAVPGVSASGRFEFAYTAAHALALASLRLNALRPANGPGHRAIVFLTLPQTIDAPQTLASSLNRYHTKRNKSEYGEWSEVSEAEARDMLELATALQRRVLEWIRRQRPEMDA